MDSYRGYVRSKTLSFTFHHLSDHLSAMIEIHLPSLSLFFRFLCISVFLHYCAPRGEELFALPLTEYPELMQTQKEVKLADQLFSLYVDVLGTLSDWKNVIWSDVTKQIGKILSTFVS